MSTLIADTLRDVRKRFEYGWNVLRRPPTYRYFGVTLPLSATPDLERIRKRVYLATYERYEIEAVTRLVQPDDVVAEFGAGCGVVSGIICQRLSDSSNMHVFEANQQLRASIEAVAVTNGFRLNVTTAAVGPRAGKANFYFGNSFMASSLIQRPHYCASQLVDVVCFYDVITRLKPTLIVMDIEGAERDVLTGSIPDCVRAISLELHPHVIGDDDSSKIIHNLFDQGFNILLNYSHERICAFARGA
jgi:FkbM family methyltransferase